MLHRGEMQQGELGARFSHECQICRKPGHCHNGRSLLQLPVGDTQNFQELILLLLIPDVFRENRKKCSDKSAVYNYLLFK